MWKKTGNKQRQLVQRRAVHHKRKKKLYKMAKFGNDFLSKNIPSNWLLPKLFGFFEGPSTGCSSGLSLAFVGTRQWFFKSPSGFSSYFYSFSGSFLCFDPFYQSISVLNCKLTIFTTTSEWIIIFFQVIYFLLDYSRTWEHNCASSSSAPWITFTNIPNGLRGFRTGVLVEKMLTSIGFGRIR